MIKESLVKRLQDVGGSIKVSGEVGVHSLKDNSLSLSLCTLEIGMHLRFAGEEVARVLLNKKLHIHLPGVVFDFALMVAKGGTGILDLIRLNHRDSGVQLKEVVVGG